MRVVRRHCFVTESDRVIVGLKWRISRRRGLPLIIASALFTRESHQSRARYGHDASAMTVTYGSSIKSFRYVPKSRSIPDLSQKLTQKHGTMSMTSIGHEVCVGQYTGAEIETASLFAMKQDSSEISRQLCACEIHQCSHAYDIQSK